MTTYKPPTLWNAKKFAVRYGLDPMVDFYIDGSGLLVVMKELSDNPPIFESDDPPQPTEVEKMKIDIEVLKTKVAALETDVKAVKEVVIKPVKP